MVFKNTGCEKIAMKIYFDNIIFSLQKSGGISVYFYEILKRFQKDKRKFYILDSAGRNNENIFYKQLNISSEKIEEKSIFFNKILRYLDTKIKEKEKFIFHSTYYRVCNSKKAINITTVHDFTYEKYFKGLKKYVHSFQKKRAILRSDLIICISENTKKDLLNFIPEAKNKKIEVIYNGISEEFYKKEKIENNFDKEYSKQKYILYVGARRGYKNFKLALEIISRLEREFILIFVGGEELSLQEKKEIESFLGERYEHLKGVSTEKLNSLYNYAFCLLYPSEYEGFGIPVLEAMRAGCPVLAYENSSIPEVSGPSLLVKENNVVNYLENIEKLLIKDNRDKIIEEGIKYSQNFSWNETYKRLLEIYLKY